jgi:hypothetical protein
MLKPIMRKILLGIALFAGVGSAAGQGTLIFRNHVGSGNVAFYAPVYGPDPGNPSLQTWGNASNGVPAGTQTYLGSTLSGTNYSVALWSSLTPVSDAFALNSDATLVGGSITSLTSLAGPGLFTGSVVIMDGVQSPITYGAFLQVRVWDNAGGQLGSWTDAWNAAQAGSGRVVGWSSVFWQYLGVGGGLPTPYMDSFRSFNTFVVPEPRPTPLIAAGGAVLWLLGRRRREPEPAHSCPKIPET